MCSRADGNGRAPVAEALIANPAVRDVIRESRLGDLANLMNAGEQEMSSFSRHANSLVDAGTITRETAKMVQADSGTSTHGSGTGGGGGGKRRKGD